MTTTHIDSIINPQNYNYAYNYNLTSDLKHLYIKKQQINVADKNKILNIISNTNKDKKITGGETFIYKDTDGNLKSMDINGVSDIIFKKIQQKLISQYDKKQDENINNVSNSVNEILNINVWKKFEEK